MDIALLTKQLQQEDPAQYESQKSALLSLGDAATPEATSLLLNVVQHYQNRSLLSFAMSALAKIGNPEAIEALSQLMFEHPSLENRSEASRALGYSRTDKALPPLKKLLSDGLKSEEGLPVKEALWALANLCQAEVFKPDAEWEALIEQWRERGGEYSIMARHIRICWEGQITIS